MTEIKQGLNEPPTKRDTRAADTADNPCKPKGKSAPKHPIPAGLKQFEVFTPPTRPKS